MADLVSHPDEVKVVSKRFGLGATNLDRYLELDGYKAVAEGLEHGPDAVVNEVKNSGLRGRGGAGFQHRTKVVVRAKQAPKPKYVLCNGDESEPGTCKDRLIFEHDPHAVIEGRNDRRPGRGLRTPDTSTFVASTDIFWRLYRKRLRMLTHEVFLAKISSAAATT